VKPLPSADTGPPTGVAASGAPVGDDGLGDVVVELSPAPPVDPPLPEPEPAAEAEAAAGRARPTRAAAIAAARAWE
jgi:hypothetical protein